jgi:type I restriction enzyme S subunit
MRWGPATLDSLCLHTFSGGTPPTNNDAYYGGDIPWLRTQEVTFGRIFDTEIKITETGLKNSSAKWVPEKSVIVAMYGNSAGRSAINEIPLTTNQACCNLIIDPDKADYRYVFYALLRSYETLKGLSRGAAQNNLNAAQVKAFTIPAPPVQVQQDIGDILSSYDDLIENNRRRMALLEESARLLYREWFVRLRFPGHEHTRIVDGLPEGWGRNTLAELACFLKRGITPAYDDEAEGLVINQKCIRDGRVNLGLARNQSKEVKPERLLQLGDVLVNSTGEGTLGRIAQVKTLLPNCTVDTHVTIVRPKEGVARHYFGLAVMEWERRFSTMGKGATNQTELSPTTIGNAEIVMPSRTLLEQFELFAGPLYEQVTNLERKTPRRP